MFNLQIAKADIEIERETYQTSRSGLNEMYTEAKEKLQEEAQAREVSEKWALLQANAFTKTSQNNKCIKTSSIRKTII